MNKMVASEWLSVSPEGPVSMSGDAVHFRQGDLDGACGPYCLFMSLVTLGLLKRVDCLDISSWKGSSREGKFRDALMAFGVLGSDGTYDRDLEWLVSFFKAKKLKAKSLPGSKKEMFAEAVQAIDSGELAIAGVRWQGGGGHWLLVVGYQGIEDEYGILQATHLLCLDPGAETPRAALWNSVVEVFDPNGYSVNSGSLSSNYWGLSSYTTKCQMEDMVRIGLG